MTSVNTERVPRAPLADLSTNLEPLTRTYDPPVRGPIMLASAGSGRTDATFYLAGALAERLGVGVEIGGVLEPNPVLLLGDQPSLYPPDFESIQREVIKSAIVRRLCAVGREAERWPVGIFYGDPGKTVARVARERDSTMIVCGLGKHDLANRLPGGERALRIVRAADRPVLAVSSDAIALPKTAVVGMDFSPSSVRAARAALLTLADDGLLVLVHVRPRIDLLPLYASAERASHSYETLLAQWRLKTEAETAALFSRVRDELRPYLRTGMTLETETRSGVVLEELLTAADEKDAQMIAVGTHGPGVFERLFVGSVATEILRHARRSVLVAPPPNVAEVTRIELRLRGTADFTRADDWAAALGNFSARNDGRRVRLEVDDPDIGAQVQQSGFALLGVAYDHHDQRVVVMLGDARDGTRHLTRSISHVDDVSIMAAPNGPECALRVLSGRSQTLLTFID